MRKSLNMQFRVQTENSVGEAVFEEHERIAKRDTWEAVQVDTDKFSEIDQDFHKIIILAKSFLVLTSGDDFLLIRGCQSSI